MLEMRENSKFVIYEKLFSKLKNDNYFGRLGKTFNTNEYFYFLDTGTGKVARVNENVYKVLKCLLENDDFESLRELSMNEDDIVAAFKEIELAVEKEHILSAPILETMSGEAVSNLEVELNTKMTGVTFELTEECNLRCKYCIYHPSHPSYREFGKRHMSFETAKKALDLLKQNANKEGEVIYIGFYGGEPLLNFDVLKASVEYANKIFQNKKIQYNVTTNATLLTKSISDYLVKQDFTVTISLDGPKEIHDENRAYINGKGSFHDTIRGIENFVESSQESNVSPKFMINIVTSGTNYEEKFEKIDEFIKNCSWYSEDNPIRINLVDEGPQKAKYILPQSEDERKFQHHMIESVGEWTDNKTKDFTENEDIISKSTLNQLLLRLHKRQLSSKPIQQYSMNGCCVPGQRKSYVSVDGDIFPCERIGNHIPSLGNVDEGFDILKVKKYYVDDFIHQSKSACKNCWAVNLCGLCYVNCYDENGMNHDYKNDLCVHERFTLEKGLIRYHKILEKNPKILEIFNDMVMY